MVFLLPFRHRLAFSAIRYPPGSWALLTVGLPNTPKAVPRTPTGLPRSAHHEAATGKGAL